MLYQAELHSAPARALYIAVTAGPQDAFRPSYELARGASDAYCHDRMGRSQVVRQRFLVPPFAGSNPAAPAKRLNGNEISELRLGPGGES